MFRILVTAACLCQLVTFVSALSLRINFPPLPLLPNPNTLPASTHAVLTSGTGPPVTALLRKGNYIEFSDIQTTGSHLLNIYSHEYVFAPYRVDIVQTSDGPVISGAWETFRGTKWEDKGVGMGPVPSSNLTISAKVQSKRGFYEQRQGFNPLSLLKNPMILMGVFALVFTFGMPKLMENMDPEMRAEYEEMHKKSPMGGITQAMQGGGAGGANNFDLAGYLAGSGKGSGAERGSDSIRERKR